MLPTFQDAVDVLRRGGAGDPLPTSADALPPWADVGAPSSLGMTIDALRLQSNLTTPVGPRRRMPWTKVPPRVAAAPVKPAMDDAEPPATLPPPPAGAAVAETMADINFAETKVFPAGAGPEIDNIQLVKPRWFKFILRHRGAWYDGDRDGKNNREGKPKSRAEIYGMCSRKLGTLTPFKIGETWLIGSTVRLAPDFVPGAGYCNLMQPANHQSFLNMTKLDGNTVTVELCVFSDGIGSKINVARRVQIKRGEWTTLVVKAKFAKDGYYGLSVNGDEFQGITIDTTKSGDRKPPFGGNFGLYGNAARGADGKPLRDQVVDHYNMFYKKL